MVRGYVFASGVQLKKAYLSSTTLCQFLNTVQQVLARTLPILKTDVRTYSGHPYMNLYQTESQKDNRLVTAFHNPEHREDDLIKSSHVSASVRIVLYNVQFFFCSCN